MLEALVSGEMAPGDFEMEFFAHWGDDRRSSHRDSFQIFEEFAFVVEDYVDNPELRDPANGDLGPDELKERARELLRRAGFDPPPET
ncbi:MAG TPA: hypothetical protein VE442_02005 [Jatrophihabitans sp.]|jgi:hypothetical protein|nr:hypothetical protein [Jatrophihabitans sp.]